MPGIESISTGLDPTFQSAFEKVSEANRRPITRLEDRKGDIKIKVDLLNDVIGRVEKVKDLLPGLSTPIAIREFAVSSTDTKVITGTADKSVALPGSHKIQVLQLAKSSTALSNGFPDKDETRIGTGYFEFENRDGETKEVFIDNDTATLEGVARTINDAKMGIRASVIYDGTDEELPYRLLISKTDVGAENDIEYPEFFFVDPEEEFYIDKISSAENAILRFEGFEIESPTNKIDSLIPGVTVNILGISEAGKPDTLTVLQDIPQTTIKVKELIDGVNEVLKFIQDQNKIDENTNTRKTLGGDYGIRLAENKIRIAVQTNFIDHDPPKHIRALSDMGITYNKKGTLDFDEKDFSQALDAHFDEALELLTGTPDQEGVITKLSRAMDAISSPGRGILSTQKTTYTDQMRRIDRDIERKQEIVQRKEARLKEKLVKAQNAIQALNNQSSLLPQGQGGLGGLIG